MAAAGGAGRPAACTHWQWQNSRVPPPVGPTDAEQSKRWCAPQHCKRPCCSCARALARVGHPDSKGTPFARFTSTKVQILVLAPSRELASQILQETHTYTYIRVAEIHTCICVYIHICMYYICYIDRYS